MSMQPAELHGTAQYHTEKKLCDKSLYRINLAIIYWEHVRNTVHVKAQYHKFICVHNHVIATNHCDKTICHQIMQTPIHNRSYIIHDHITDMQDKSQTAQKTNQRKDLRTEFQYCKSVT